MSHNTPSSGSLKAWSVTALTSSLVMSPPEWAISSSRSPNLGCAVCADRGRACRVPDDHHIRIIEGHGGDLLRAPFGDPLIVVAQSLADVDEERGGGRPARGESRGNGGRVVRPVREHGYGVMGCQKAGQVRKRYGVRLLRLPGPVPVQADQQGVVPRLPDAGEGELDAGDVRDDFDAVPAELQDRPPAYAEEERVPRREEDDALLSPSEAFANKRRSSRRGYRSA